MLTRGHITLFWSLRAASLHRGLKCVHPIIILTAHPYRGDWTLQQVPLHGGRPLTRSFLRVGHFPPCPRRLTKAAGLACSLISSAEPSFSKACVPELASHRLRAQSSAESRVTQPRTLFHRALAAGFLGSYHFIPSWVFLWKPWKRPALIPGFLVCNFLVFKF